HLAGGVTVELAAAGPGQLRGQVLADRHRLVAGWVDGRDTAGQRLDHRVHVAVVEEGGTAPRHQDPVAPRGGDAVQGGDPLLVRPAGDRVAQVDQQGAVGGPDRVPVPVLAVDLQAGNLVGPQH